MSRRIMFFSLSILIQFGKTTRFEFAYECEYLSCWNFGPSSVWSRDQSRGGEGGGGGLVCPSPDGASP